MKINIRNEEQLLHWYFKTGNGVYGLKYANILAFKEGILNPRIFMKYYWKKHSFDTQKQVKTLMQVMSSTVSSMQERFADIGVHFTLRIFQKLDTK